MPVKKALRPVEVFLLDKAHVLALFYFFAQETPNLVIQHIPGYRSRHEQRHGAPAHDVGSCERAGREDERIPRQKRRNDQACLTKYHEKQYNVNRSAVLLHERAEVGVQVEEKVEQVTEIQKCISFSRFADVTAAFSAGFAFGLGSSPARGGRETGLAAQFEMNCCQYHTI